MRRAGQVAPAGAYAADQVVARVELDFDRRHRRRLVLSAGRLQVLLDLAETAHLRDGDGLMLDGGGVVQVAALPEPLLEITADSLAALVRIAWHLGNRHLPTQLRDGALRIRADHVIAEMVRGLGGTVTAIAAPFDPEGGAYGHDHGA